MPADDSTVGIDVRRWWLGAGQAEDTEDCESDEPIIPEELVAHIFDVAGRRVYRASHGAFMSADTLFLHVVRSDNSEESAAAAVLEWVESVQQEAPGAVMGVVWTRVDLEVEAEDEEDSDEEDSDEEDEDEENSGHEDEDEEDSDEEDTEEDDEKEEGEEKDNEKLKTTADFF